MYLFQTVGKVGQPGHIVDFGMHIVGMQDDDLCLFALGKA